jgi:hypothetical protein
MEACRYWQREIKWMHHLTQLWQAVEAGDRQELARYVSWKEGKVTHRWPPLETYEDENDPRRTGREVWGERILVAWGKPLFRYSDLEGPALYFVKQKVNAYLGSVHPKLVWSVDRRRPELTYHVDSLLGAMYWQFAESLGRGWKYRQCPVCLKAFQIAPGANRASRITCSNTCRTYLYRQRMEKARELHQQGKTPKAIAKELQTTVKTVQNWIAKEQ